MLIDIPLHARDFVKVFDAGGQHAPSKECGGRESRTGSENGKELRYGQLKTPNK